VQEHCRKPAVSARLIICLTVMKFGVPFTFELWLSAKKLKRSPGRKQLTFLETAKNCDMSLHLTTNLAFEKISFVGRLSGFSCTGCGPVLSCSRLKAASFSEDIYVIYNFFYFEYAVSLTSLFC